MVGAGVIYDFKLYRYVPSLPAAVVTSVLFGGLAAAHTFRLLRNKTWFCIPFIVGGLCGLPHLLVEDCIQSNRPP
jgi:hypothetical protein